MSQFRRLYHRTYEVPLIWFLCLIGASLIAATTFISIMTVWFGFWGFISAYAAFAVCAGLTLDDARATVRGHLRRAFTQYIDCRQASLPISAAVVLAYPGLAMLVMMVAASAVDVVKLIIVIVVWGLMAALAMIIKLIF
jgi:hypothetical protein